MLGLVLAAVLAADPATAAPAAPALADLQGRWACEGRFEPSGKPIRATLDMAWLEGPHALLVRHDDLPPAGYHSVELWSAAPAGAPWRAVVADAFSVQRAYQSPGWSAEGLAWTRLDAGGAPVERFTYVLSPAGELRVDWERARDGRLVLGDRIACRRG